MDNRAFYMTQAQRTALGKQKRTHQNCMEATGVARPGKTAKDRTMRQRSRT